jgi:membrane protein implicated in regulation of membrane protease activity
VTVELWLLIGAILLAIEFIVTVPTFFIAGALGVAAILTSPFALFLPPGLQVIVWVMFAGLFVWFSRRWIPRNLPELTETSTGVTITEIPPGEFGRVKWEGVSWRAICDDPTLSIGENVRVQILYKKGTTLVVLPENYIEHGNFLSTQSREGGK